jgi:ribosome-binding protein aMBF1 (putative translation factor)
VGTDTGTRERNMENEERVLARERMDKEQRYFRIAGKKASYLPQWLRRVRQVLGVHATDMARTLNVNTSVIYRLEKSEDKKAISLRAMEKAAEAMDCKVVYAIVPRGGKTLMELAERQRWRKKLGKAGSRE